MNLNQGELKMLNFTLITCNDENDFNNILCELPSGTYLNMEEEQNPISQSILMTKHQFNSFFEMIENMCNDEVIYCDYQDYLSDIKFDERNMK
jgi:hypothetical protein